MFKRKQNFQPEKLSKLVVPGKYVVKGRKKRPEVLKNDLNKRSKTYCKELVINGLSFPTESSRIWEEGLIREEETY